jgi:hypothetical protein
MQDETAARCVSTQDNADKRKHPCSERNSKSQSNDPRGQEVSNVSPCSGDMGSSPDIEGYPKRSIHFKKFILGSVYLFLDNPV